MFQFPSNGKVYSETYQLIYQSCVTITSFNSLQTGKCIQRTGRICVLTDRLQSFNSLQTGKCIQRMRHSVYRKSMGFNSLQTGKCIQSSVLVYNDPNGFSEVSIPFKRESVFRVHYQVLMKWAFYIVSIPFKRESVFRGIREELGLKNDQFHKFQFPSNGKVYSEISPQSGFTGTISLVFQFPSNGKVYSEFNGSFDS